MKDKVIINHNDDSFVVIETFNLVKDGKKHLRFTVRCNGCGAVYYSVSPQDLLKGRFLCVWCNAEPSKDKVLAHRVHHPQLDKYLMGRIGDDYVIYNRFTGHELTGEHRNGKLYGFNLNGLYWSIKKLVALVPELD